MSILFIRRLLRVVQIIWIIVLYGNVGFVFIYIKIKLFLLYFLVCVVEISYLIVVIVQLQIVIFLKLLRYICIVVWDLWTNSCLSNSILIYIVVLISHYSKLRGITFPSMYLGTFVNTWVFLINITAI